MKKIHIILMTLIVLTIGFVSYNSHTGVSKSDIEKQARIDLSVDSNWKAEKAIGNSVSGILFYDQTRSAYKYAIYIKKPLSLEFFFTSGGCTQLEMKGVVKYTNANSLEAVYLSMNKQKVNRIELNNGNNIEEVEVDHTKPFAVIFPSDAKSVTFQDIDGNHVEIIYFDNY